MEKPKANAQNYGKALDKNTTTLLVILFICEQEWKVYICILKMLHLRAIGLRMIGRNEAILIVFVVSRISYEGWYFFFPFTLGFTQTKDVYSLLFSAPDY